MFSRQTKRKLILILKFQFFLGIALKYFYNLFLRWWVKLKCSLFMIIWKLACAIVCRSDTWRAKPVPAFCPGKHPKADCNGSDDFLKNSSSNVNKSFIYVPLILSSELALPFGPFLGEWTVDLHIWKKKSNRPER